MALEKITEAQMNANGVIAAPDVLNGTPAENKAIFDRMVRSVVAPAYNACVDAVNALQALEAGLEANEEQRATAEAGRVGAETNRVSAETARVQAELRRVAAELARATAETNRENAEAARENNETGYVAQANNAATEAQSWAEGGTGSREGEDTNNAKYWSEQAKENATGDMKKSVYDPQGKATDIFAYADERSGSGAHIGPDEPTGGETVWIDTDDEQGSFYTAAQVDELLTKAVRMIPVWENASPTSQFLEQTVSREASQHTFFAVKFMEDCRFPGEDFRYVFAMLNEQTQVCSPSWTSSVTMNFWRRFTVKGAEIVFGPCLKQGTEDESCLIPVAVYGLEGVTVNE